MKKVKFVNFLFEDLEKEFLVYSKFGKFLYKVNKKDLESISFSSNQVYGILSTVLSCLTKDIFGKIFCLKDLVKDLGDIINIFSVDWKRSNEELVNLILSKDFDKIDIEKVGGLIDLDNIVDFILKNTFVVLALYLHINNDSSYIEDEVVDYRSEELVKFDYVILDENKYKNFIKFAERVTKFSRANGYKVMYFFHYENGIMKKIVYFYEIPLISKVYVLLRKANAEMILSCIIDKSEALKINNSDLLIIYKFDNDREEVFNL